MENRVFSHVELRNITLPGRVVRSATELFCSYPDGHMHPYEIQTYRELAEAGLGMIITAHTCVSPEGRSNIYQNAAWSDEYIDELELTAKTAGANKTPVILQLGHGGMKAENNNGGLRVYTPDNMTETEISGVVEAFATAALRAKTAGFSGVMLHAAHMYLLSQFFYPEYNHRTDGYGGNAEKRFRIVREIFERIKETCGESFPVFMKINGDDRENTAEYHRDVVYALNLCAKLGMDAAEISGYDSARRGRPDKPYFIDNISALHIETSLPLIAVGGVRTIDDINALLDRGAVAVSMSRPFLQDPQVLSCLVRGEGSGCTGCCFCFTPLDPNSDRMIRCPNRKTNNF